MTRRGGWGVAVAAAAAIAACAHIEPPSGGPVDETAPELLVTRPDSLVVRPDWSGPVVLVFDERISERGAREAVSVSPRTSPVVVDHKGDELRVSLREGWQPGVIYHINVTPPIQDLFSNERRTPARLVFSTGPEIPDTRLSGTVIDRVTTEPEVGARVEAVRTADSLTYTVLTDSTGSFDLSRVPEGSYLIRAFRDMNRSRTVDGFEPQDTTGLALVAGTASTAGLALLEPDSTAATITSVSVDDGRITVEFDDYLDPAEPLLPARIQIRSAGGALARVDSVLPVLAAAAAGGRRSARAAAQDSARADTVAPATPRPYRSVVLVLAEDVELEPGAEYSMTIGRVRNLVGLQADAEKAFTAPAGQERRAPREEAPDTAAVPPDTAGARRTPTIPDP